MISGLQHNGESQTSDFNVFAAPYPTSCHQFGARSRSHQWRRLLRFEPCPLQEVDGLSSLPKLRELYAAFNDIEDLAPIAGLENLEVSVVYYHKTLNQTSFVCSKYCENGETEAHQVRGN